MFIFGIFYMEFGMKIGRVRFDEKYDDDREIWSFIVLVCDCLELIGCRVM